MSELYANAISDERLKTAFGDLFVNINNLQTFYTTTKDLLDAGKDYLEQKLVKTGKEELTKPEWQRFSSLKTLSQYEGLGLTDSVFRATAKRAARISKQVAESAVLVFAHTILDGTLSECCSISFETAPSDWYSFVEKRKVELGDLKNVKGDSIFHRKAQEFVNQINRESMIQRLEFLHKVCVPKLNGEQPITHWIKLVQLEEFDLVRHRVIHSQKFAQKNPDVEDQVLFAALVGFSALALVGKAYGLKAGGILDKESTDVERVWSNLFSGLGSDFPELFEQLERDFTKIVDMIKTLAKQGPAKT
jgi:hypothetical protein